MSNFETVVRVTLHWQKGPTVALVNPQACSGLFQMDLPLIDGDTVESLLRRLKRTNRTLKGTLPSSRRPLLRGFKYIHLGKFFKKITVVSILRKTLRHQSPTLRRPIVWAASVAQL